jgi:hypothetical protein
MRRRAGFRRLVDRFQAECEKQGVDLSPDSAEDFLVDRVASMAQALGVREETVVRSHLARVDVTGWVAAFKRAGEELRREVADASPAVLSLEQVGRLVASLGQAVRCVSLNHESLGRGEAEKWEAIGVLDDASNALTIVGAELRASQAVSGRVCVLLSDEAVVSTRRTLVQTIENLTSGEWSYNQPTVDDAMVAARMSADLALLPPRPRS